MLLIFVLNVSLLWVYNPHTALQSICLRGVKRYLSMEAPCTNVTVALSVVVQNGTAWMSMMRLMGRGTMVCPHNGALRETVCVRLIPEHVSKLAGWEDWRNWLHWAMETHKTLEIVRSTVTTETAAFTCGGRDGGGRNEQEETLGIITVFLSWTWSYDKTSNIVYFSKYRFTTIQLDLIYFFF